MPSIVFTKTAAARLLPFASSILTISVLSNGALVVIYKVGKTKCATFLSKKAFYQDFANYRASKAKECQVSVVGEGKYKCYSSPNRVYNLSVDSSKITCQCDDYQAQVQELGALAECKHCVAVKNIRSTQKLRLQLEEVFFPGSVSKAYRVFFDGKLISRDFVRSQEEAELVAAQYLRKLEIYAKQREAILAAY